VARWDYLTQYIDNIMNNKLTRIGYNKTYDKLLMRESFNFISFYFIVRKDSIDRVDIFLFLPFLLFSLINIGRAKVIIPQ
jgi:hypothetical protein